jgi:cAMP phosphodiesterase
MSASIKVREEDKKEFESLQSELTLRFGKKITQQELFSRIIELVEDSNSKKSLLTGCISPLSEEKIEKIRELQSDWEIVTREENIDELLYEK